MHKSSVRPLYIDADWKNFFRGKEQVLAQIESEKKEILFEISSL